jgi:hypothetical protein
MKKPVIRVELDAGFIIQVQEMCKAKGMTLNDAVESGLLRELRYHKKKDCKTK